MGIIQGFYQLRAYSNTNYMLYYPRSGSPVMRTTGYDVNNYTTWMMWQPSSDDASYVQLISATNSNYNSSSMYEMLASSNPSTQVYNTYELNWIGTTTPTVITDTLTTAIDTSSMSQFVMTKIGTITFNGKERDVVTLKLPYNSKFLDYTKAIANANTSPTLEDESTGDTQKWVLEPINPRYEALVAPSNIYLQTSTSGTSTKTLDWWTTNTLYWQWTASDNTILAGDTYNFAERDVTKNNLGTTTYGDWSYLDVGTLITSGNKQYRETATIIPSCSDTIKQVGKQIQIQTKRSVEALGYTTAFLSATATQSIYFAKQPTLAKDGLSWTPDGMKINFTSNYFGQGSLFVKIKDVCIMRVGPSIAGRPPVLRWTNILTNPFSTSLITDSTITIPTKYFSEPPQDGESVYFQNIYIGTDVYNPDNYSVSITDTLTYNEGTVDVTPTITELDGLRYSAVVPYAGTVKMWMSVDGDTFLLDGTVENDSTTFEIIPPFQTEYALFTSYENADKTVWGTAYTEMPEISIRAHCFTWSGGSVVIWLNKDTALTEEFTFSPQSTTHTLAGHSHDIVTYLSDGDKNYTSVTGTVKGYIVPQLETYGTTRDSIEEMIEQGHVVYRAPYGRICNVAVTGADITTDKGISEVSVSIVQEDDSEQQISDTTFVLF